jgi:hypothetical protein
LSDFLFAARIPARGALAQLSLDILSANMTALGHSVKLVPFVWPPMG